MSRVRWLLRKCVLSRARPSVGGCNTTHTRVVSTLAAAAAAAVATPPPPPLEPNQAQAVSVEQPGFSPARWLLSAPPPPSA